MESMRKAGLLIVLLMIAIPLFFASCSKTKTYAEKLKAEKKAIERFMDKRGYYLIKEFPKDSVFPDENAFYRTSEGLYLHIIDKQYAPYGEFAGDSVKMGSRVNVRYKEKINFMIAPDTFSSNWDNIIPIDFVHGALNDTYAPKGWDIALDYVGYFGLVRMIVPSIIGTSSDNYSVNPVFYDHLWYKPSY